ncbi:hypothetical protein M409DRAFT_23527 [Zasmidium cellare ATCC 36951]|uniref:Uncharacterized protein n=1 Tax=Zasmidium cellare ATCC 36951 TaxID=1080233 RepID=A0A6A6CGQ2_ZASCE|nr:uncharacterized protein M409DRAFT_23527 [Zasmidium cellare ATCC 36951]KAF2166335.1 hypothetical protein M409DRAFT_23527 [Zasmidium cellare ATCC 36951]
MEDTVDRKFTKRFNEVAQLYDDDALEECINKGRTLLDDPALPRYHRMKTWVLLGSIVGDWEEAEEFCVKARSLWRIELWETTDELEEAIGKEEPEGYDYDVAVDGLIDGYDADMAGAKELAEAEGEEPEEGEGFNLPLRTAEESTKHENEQQESSGGKDGDSSHSTS